jgi:hypothetical protein
MVRKIVALLSLSVFLTACTGTPDNNPVGECPVTTPSEQSAALPIDIEYEGRFWYGTPALWANLPSDGIWQELPHDDTGYVQKAVFWREDFNAISEPNPALILTGRRLSGSTLIFTENEATHGFDETGNFMLIGVSIPAGGCWEITAEYKAVQLSFVVLVVP